MVSSSGTVDAATWTYGLSSAIQGSVASALKEKQFSIFYISTKLYFQHRFSYNNALQETLTMSPGNNNNRLTYTSIPSRSEENCCVQYHRTHKFSAAMAVV